MNIQPHHGYIDGRGGYQPTTGNWTAQRIASLIRLWNDGQSATEVGHALGITRNAVLGKINRLLHGGDKRITRPLNSNASGVSLRVIVNHEKIMDEDDIDLLLIVQNPQPGDVWSWDDIADWFGKPVAELKARYQELHDEYWLSEAA